MIHPAFKLLADLDIKLTAGGPAAPLDLNKITKIAKGKRIRMAGITLTPDTNSRAFCQYFSHGGTELVRSPLSYK